MIVSILAGVALLVSIVVNESCPPEPCQKQKTEQHTEK